MKAAVVREQGGVPAYEEFADPQAMAGECMIELMAAALSPVTRSRASGAHYSAAGRYPLVAGIDGVGRTSDGERVYFVMPRAPWGCMAQKVAAEQGRCVPLPVGIDAAMAAAIANPGMSSWAAYTERARLKAGETVLVNGATGAAGRLAVQIAGHMGAGRVIATGRDTSALAEVAALGADATIVLTDEGDALENRFREEFESGVDIVIDYLWGPSAERLLIAAARDGRDAVPIRFVQVGAASGADITLPAAVLRSSAIEMMGSGIGSIPLDSLVKAIRALFEAAAEKGFAIATRTMPLSEVGVAWTETGPDRIVLTTEALSAA